MKSRIRSITRRLLSNEAFWIVLCGIASQVPYLRVQRAAALEERFQRKIAALFSSGQVLTGPFAGTKMPVELLYWGATCAKTLGIYESELHAHLERLSTHTYDTIVDIGFAEGYYLVGLGRRFASAKLCGFDISPKAHAVCRNLAELNDIPADRLDLKFAATAAGLKAALDGRRALVICDCEGFEQELFSTTDRTVWQSADLIVECHDFLQPDATASVVAALQSTHVLGTIGTTTPNARAQTLGALALARDFSEAELLRLVDEGRPAPQHWIIATSQQSTTNEA